MSTDITTIENAPFLKESMESLPNLTEVKAYLKTVLITHEQLRSSLLEQLKGKLSSKVELTQIEQFVDQALATDVTGVNDSASESDPSPTECPVSDTVEQSAKTIESVAESVQSAVVTVEITVKDMEKTIESASHVIESLGVEKKTIDEVVETLKKVEDVADKVEEVAKKVDYIAEAAQTHVGLLRRIELFFQPLWSRLHGSCTSRSVDVVAKDAPVLVVAHEKTPAEKSA